MTRQGPHGGWRLAGPPTSTTSPLTAASMTSSTSPSRSAARSPLPARPCLSVSGVDAVQLRRQGELGAPDPPAQDVCAGWTQVRRDLPGDPWNSQEEHGREQLNSCIINDDIDVHCL